MCIYVYITFAAGLRKLCVVPRCVLRFYTYGPEKMKYVMVVGCFNSSLTQTSMGLIAVLSILIDQSYSKEGVRRSRMGGSMIHLYISREKQDAFLHKLFQIVHTDSDQKTIMKRFYAAMIRLNSSHTRIVTSFWISAVTQRQKRFGVNPRNIIPTFQVNFCLMKKARRCDSCQAQVTPKTTS